MQAQLQNLDYRFIHNFGITIEISLRVGIKTYNLLSKLTNSPLTFLILMLSFQSSILRVLVVDDHELTRFSLKVALQRQANLELVGLASNGQEAVDMVKASHPNLVILDLQMPVMDGASASHEIKRIDPAIKIIGYSSVRPPQSNSLIEAADLDAFCDKSTPTCELLDLAWRLID